MIQDKKKEDEQTSEQNPTLDSPGSKVADYGNTTGGTATEDSGHKQDQQSGRQGNSSIPLNEEDTIGNT